MRIKFIYKGVIRQMLNPFNIIIKPVITEKATS